MTFGPEGKDAEHRLEGSRDPPYSDDFAYILKLLERVMLRLEQL